MPRVVHFDLSADDPERASKFYSTVFGWKIEKWQSGGPMEYWMVKTGEDPEPGISGGLSRRQGSQPCVNTIDVPSVDEFSAKVTKAGGKILAPKMEIPGVGVFVMCQDTEGTAFGIMQFTSR